MRFFVFVCLFAFGLQAPVAQASFKSKFVKIITLGIKKDKPETEGTGDEVAPPPPQAGRTSTLTGFELDDQLNAQNLTLRGFVQVAGKQARLVVEGSTVCPPGRVCPQAAVLRKVFDVTLPVTGTRTDRACGATVITAKVDNRFRDAGLQKLVITDNSTIDFTKCRFVVAPIPLEATFETEARTRAGFQATESRFFGSALQ